MKKLLLATVMLLSLKVAFADEYQNFHNAVSFYAQNRYHDAKSLFVSCKASGEFDSVNIQIWIDRCDAGLKEQRQNAQAAAERDKRKLAQRKKDSLVFISVNAAETGALVDRIKSAMGEVMRKNNGRHFCSKISDALDVVSVFYNMSNVNENNGFYKVSATGTVSLGSAISDNYVGQWTVDCEATSAVGAEDAKRLLQNKLNHKLGYALDNLLNGRPQSSEYYIPEQSIAIYFAEDNSEEQLSFLKESLSSYISKVPGLKLSTAIDQSRNAERDKIAKIQAMYVKQENRAPVHELDGFNQVLRISAKEHNGYINFSGEIQELATGNSLSTVTINGKDFTITNNSTNDIVITSKDMELVAKLLAVGLGFKEWEFGEDIGEDIKDIGRCKLAAFNGMHGLYYQFPIDNTRSTTSAPSTGSPDKTFHQWNKALPPSMLGPGFRLPTVKELLHMRENKEKLGLSGGVYWSADAQGKNKYYIVDFSSEDAPKAINKNKFAASILYVKDF